MKTLAARNVHEIFPEALRTLYKYGEPQESRAGTVLVYPTPVTSIYHRPDERVMFWGVRDANPFFHLMECIWMMAGRQDVKWLAQFNRRMREFSDDGVTFHAAYGHRWRNHFGFDQLECIITGLQANPNCRRQVLGIWDPREDLGGQGNDFPCNDLAMFQIRDGKLMMMVSNRSNDILWGCYGANAVHFSFLQEFIARAVGVPLGHYYQISFNWHGYTDYIATPGYKELADQYDDLYGGRPLSPYSTEAVSTEPLLVEGEDWRDFLKDAEEFCQWGSSKTYRTIWFNNTATPMLRTWMVLKKIADKPARWAQAIDYAEAIEAQDWALACVQWLERRIARYEEEKK